MNRRTSLASFLCVFITTYWASLVVSAEGFSKSEPPNVVVLLADDLGYRDIGCYDGPVATPTLDRLAAEGVRFTDFHSGAAVCSPSRATMLTGRQHIRTGVYSWIHDHVQDSQLLKREVTLAEVLQSSGYKTAHFGKWHLGMPTPRKPNKSPPSGHGFDYWFGMGNGAHPSHKNPVNFLRNGSPVGKVEGYSCQIVVDEAISWLDEKRDHDKPFFLNIWFHEPHAPIAAPDEIVSHYGDVHDPGAIYSGTIDNTDQAIARLLQKLEQIDAPDNTLIIYSSDNGSYRADRVGRLRGTKGSNYEGGIRVPGIFYWPGTIPAGEVEDEAAGLVDLLPTVCGLIGISPPQNVHLDGADLSPLLTGRREEFVRSQPETIEIEPDLELPSSASPIPEVEEQAVAALLAWGGGEYDRNEVFSFNEEGRVVCVDLSRIPEANDDSLSHVAVLSELEELCAASPEITDEGLQYIIGLKHLERLNLEGAAVTDTGIELLKQLHALRDVDVKRCGITDQAFSSFAEMENLTRIRAVRTYVTDVGLTHLKDKTNLELLDFRNCTLLTDHGLEHLRGLSNLRDLKVWGPGITNAGVEHLSALTSLRVLSLQDCSIDDAGVEQLAELTSLEDLTLFRTFITDDGLRHIGQLTNLKRLSLRANVVGSEGLAHLTTLRRLEYLDLSETIATDEGLAHLKPLSHLTELNLWAARVGDDGITHLIELQSLNKLNLESVGHPSEGVILTGEGVKRLAALPNLEWLNLNNTPVDDEGLIALGALPKLIALELNDCPNVTTEGIESLLISIPDLNIAN